MNHLGGMVISWWICTDLKSVIVSRTRSEPIPTTKKASDASYFLSHYFHYALVILLSKTCMDFAKYKPCYRKPSR